MSSCRRDFAETIRGQMFRRSARRDRQIHARIACELESKTSATIASIESFQADLNAQMAAFKRIHPYRVPVAVQLDFSAGGANPPAVHTLAKHYLDVFQQVKPGSGINRSHLLLKDDRLVKVLICNYHLGGMFGAGVGIRVATLTDFVRDMELYQRILRRDFADIDKHDRYDDWPERVSQRQREQERRLERADESYAEMLQRRELYEATVGHDAYEAMRSHSQSLYQRALLNCREPQPCDLATLYAPFVGRGIRDPMMRGIVESTAAMQKGFITHSLVSVELAPATVREGESGAFKQAVRSAIASVRASQPHMFPLLTPLAVTILYLPPPNGQTYGIDLDNLARRVIPFVHEELQPPSDIAHTLNVANMPQGEARNFFMARLAQLKRMPKYHVTRYQVFELPRGPGDPPDGAVRLMLHGGDDGFGPWDEVSSLLSDWHRWARSR